MAETDTEDPNIATLREAIRMLPREEVPYVIRELQDRANEALSALASALAERDAELTQRRADQGQLHRMLDEKASELASLSEMTQRAINAEVGQEDANGIIDELRAQARARRVPTREDIARTAFNALPPDGNTWCTVTPGTRDEWCAAADAVLRLFAEAPPVELPRLAESIRAAFYGADKSEGPWSSLDVIDRSDWINAARAAMTALGFQDSPSGGSGSAEPSVAALREDADSKPAGRTSSRGPEPLVTSDSFERIESEYRAQQRAAEPIIIVTQSTSLGQHSGAPPAEPSPQPGFACTSCSRLYMDKLDRCAWCNGPVEQTHQPGRFLDALTRRVEEVARCCRMAERDLDRRVDSQSKRLDELELQARVMRRMAGEGFSCHGESLADKLARIEREERAKSP